MKLFLFQIFFLIATFSFSQVSVVEGPELKNDPDHKLSRLIDGDDNSFYAYRVRTKGRGNSFFIEKYDKTTLQLVFSKEIYSEESGIRSDKTKKTSIIDFHYLAGNVYVFISQFNRSLNEVSLSYQTVSSNGDVSNELKKAFAVQTFNYDYFAFDIIQNTSTNKLLVRCSNKDIDYSTDLTLLSVSANELQNLWTKKISTPITKPYIKGIFLDDNDNVYYCYLEQLEKINKKETQKFNLKLGVFKTLEKEATIYDLTLDNDYYVGDVKFKVTGNNKIVLAGFLQDKYSSKAKTNNTSPAAGVGLGDNMERKLVTKWVSIGIFSFVLNINNNDNLSKPSISFFDEKMLESLESSPKWAAEFDYKLDHIFIQDDAVYLIGQQYRTTKINVNRTEYNPVMQRKEVYGTVFDYYKYLYMDVIVAKINNSGKFEWIKNVPLRNGFRVTAPYIIATYIASISNNNIYILCNDHPKNIERYIKQDYEPNDLKTVTDEGSSKDLIGSNFVSNAVSLKDGSITRSIVFENDKFCFSPITERIFLFGPPANTEIAVKGKNNETFISVEYKGRNIFQKLKFQ